MSKKSKQVKRCATRTCLNDAKSGEYCWKCAKRRWREENPEKSTFANLRSNSKRRRVGFFLSFEEFVKFVVDTSYMRFKGTGKFDMTIDRKKPKLGYRAGNIQVLPNIQNVMKYHRGEAWSPEKQSKEEAGTPF